MSVYSTAMMSSLLISSLIMVGPYDPPDVRAASEFLERPKIPMLISISATRVCDLRIMFGVKSARHWALK